jgi:F0F1-type ATP synthase membrane subunit a
MEQVASLIQAMLAPGIMISACGLLILGMNNKYSLVVTRIRTLNEEKRKYAKTADTKEFEYFAEIRIKSISIQLKSLFERLELVRNAVVCYSAGVGCFVFTSIWIGLGLVVTKTDYLNFGVVALLFFVLGMAIVLVGIIFAARESIKGFKIISFELKADE